MTRETAGTLSNPFDAFSQVDESGQLLSQNKQPSYYSAMVPFADNDAIMDNWNAAFEEPKPRDRIDDTVSRPETQWWSCVMEVYQAVLWEVVAAIVKHQVTDRGRDCIATAAEWKVHKRYTNGDRYCGFRNEGDY